MTRAARWATITVTSMRTSAGLACLGLAPGSGKMTARLQAATSSGKPVLIRVNYGGGHFGGGGQQETLESMVDDLSFLLWQLGDPAFQPQGGTQ